MLMFTVTFVICNVNTQTHTFMHMVFQHKSPVTLFNAVNVELKLTEANANATISLKWNVSWFPLMSHGN